MSAETKISAKDIAGAIHDVRQMLAVITGRVGLLSLGTNDPQLQKNLDAMEMAVAGVEHILARLLVPVCGKNPENELAGDLRRALGQSAALIQPQPGTEWQWISDAGCDSPGRTWSLKADFPEGCLSTVPEPILREILNNLLLNSLVAMPNGGLVQVDLESRQGNWSLTFQDSGCGVPSELAESIFEPGFSSSNEEGRGIGLAYCRDLLTRFGGGLELSRCQLPGACFELYLPKFESSDNNAIFQNKVAADSDPSQLTFRPQILIVDDEQSVREMLEDVFGELGCLSKVARDAPEAERIFSTNTFEMAVIDQSLPGTSGLELAKCLRRQDPYLVLVLISGWGQEEILDRARQTDVDLVAEKPITLGKIVEMLNEAGDLYHQRSEGS